MSGIGGPGGVGPKGPVDSTEGAGLSGEAAIADSQRPTAAERSLAAEHAQAAAQVGASERASLRGVDALATELSAGRITPKQALDALVEAAGADLGPTERAELREILGELLANDPHLRGLASSLG